MKFQQDRRSNCANLPKTELGGAAGQTARQLSPPYLEHRKHGQQLMVIVVFSIIIANWMIIDKHHFSLLGTQIRAVEEDIEENPVRGL